MLNTWIVQGLKKIFKFVLILNLNIWFLLQFEDLNVYIFYLDKEGNYHHSFNQINLQENSLNNYIINDYY